MYLASVRVCRTEFRDGHLVSVPFKTASKPFKRNTSSTPFGSFNPVLNATRAPPKSVYSTSYRLRSSQSAGSLHKAAQPYSMNAGRNKLPTQFKRYASPFASTLSVQHGVPAVGGARGQYTSTSRFAQRSLRRPIHQHVGSTNPGIMAETQRRLRRGALG